MKKLCFVVLAALALASCKKSEDPATDTPLTSPGLTAKIDGTVVSFGIPTVEKQASTEGNETIFLSAAAQDGSAIEISFSKQGGVISGYYTDADGAHIGLSEGNDYFSTNKIVNISVKAVDATHIVGSFIGEANNTTSGGVPKSVADGKFYANF